MRNCKNIGYVFYFEELFAVKHRPKYGCESAIYFNLDPNVIKENCNFNYYFNNSHSKPAGLDGENEIILANWAMKITLNVTKIMIFL